MPEPIFDNNPFDPEPPQIPSIIAAIAGMMPKPPEMKFYALAFRMHEIPENEINSFLKNDWHIHESFMHESNVLLIFSRIKEESSNA